MTPPRPTLVVMVDNGITGDSRVIKTALAATRGGWDVTLLGWARDRCRRETRLGAVRVLRVPLVRTLHDRFEAVRRAELDGPPEPPPVPPRAWSLRALLPGAPRAAPTGRPAPAGGPRPTGESGPADRPLPGPLLPAVAPEDVVWRRDWPILDDWWLSYRPALRELRPEVIHANDVRMLGVAARYAGETRLRGGRCAWVYDSHEFVPAVDWGHPAVSEAIRQHEREFIHRANAVVTVSRSIAELVAERHALAARPTVVENTPIAGVGPAPRAVRDVVGVGPEAALLVYSGRVARARGVHTVVTALPALPGVHLVLVCVENCAEVTDLLTLAGRLGVADRVHVAPYVDAVHVPGYLASADLGLAPFLHRPNHEESLPTKVTEYLHAGLPVVASDQRTMGAFLHETGTGVTFPAESADGCAAAVREALARRDELRAAITTDLLDVYSWQHQSRVLLDVYARVSGLRPEPRDLPWEAVEVETTGTQAGDG